MNLSEILKLTADPVAAANDLAIFADVYLAKHQQSWENDIPQIWLSPFLKIFGNSRFLPAFLIRHPEILPKLWASPFLQKQKQLEDFLNDPKSQSLHIYKYTELMRITLKDFYGDDQEIILQELSDLAQAILNEADAMALQQNIAKYGDPSCTHHLLMLGKLGARELNYSSDIDLIAIINADSGAEFYTRHVQLLTKILQERSDEGFLYRVDFDLRPEGRAGLLVHSIDAMEAYYETRGANWERQMLMKARPGAGDPQLGEEFIKRMTPFVYPKYFDLEGMRHIMQMKQKVEAELLKGSSEGFNVKLGVGGIREVEFLIQALALVFGGRDKALRHYSMIELLKRLSEHKLFLQQDAGILLGSYLFLRKLEHRLQLVEEAQTHWLNFDDDFQIKVAKRMGYVAVDDQTLLSEFRGDLNYYTTQIHDAFSGLFVEDNLVGESTVHLLSGENPEEYLALKNRLESSFKKITEFEDQINELRIFKNTELNQLMAYEHSHNFPRQSILLKITRIAEMVSQSALNLAQLEISAKYGAARYEKPNGDLGYSHLVVLGMGKLGGLEMNYSSDLDLIFLYSETGTSDGETKITNAEYFAKLVQKFIFILSVLTNHGRAYEIDTALRPSGNQGPLVISLDSFLDYHKNSAAIWERQSLLKARAIAGHSHLAKVLAGHLSALLFSSSYDFAAIRKEMHRLRSRVELELAREDPDHFDFKKGKGGIMDIEFILQYLQLCYGAQYPELQQSNTFAGLDALIALNLTGREVNALMLKEAYLFYRTMEAKLAIMGKIDFHRLSRSDPVLVNLATVLDFMKVGDLLKEYEKIAAKVRAFYVQIFSE